MAGRRGVAEPDVLIRVLFSAANSVLLLGSAAFLAFLPPVSRLRRLLAVHLALLGFLELTIGDLLLPAGSAARTAVLNVRIDVMLAANAVLAVFLCRLPAGSPWRPAPTALAAGVVALCAAAGVLWLGFRDAVSPGGPPEMRFLFHVVRQGAVGLGLVLLAGFALASTRRIPPGEAAASRVLGVVALAAYFTSAGTGLHSAVAALTVGAPGFGGYWGFLGAWPGDCCKLALVLAAATEIATWGIVLGLAVAWRSFLAASLAITGFVWTALPAGPINLFSLTYTLTSLGILFAVFRLGALGGGMAPLWLHRAFSLMVAAMVLLLTETAVLWMFPANPLALALGVVVGVVFAAGAALASHPGGLLSILWGPLPEGDETRRRVAAYRSALEAELAESHTDASLRAKLRGLRVQLGISDREHAIIEHTLRAGARGAAGSAELEPGSRFLDRYRVVRRLGESGGSATFLCRDERVGRDAVLKRLRAASPGEGGVGAVLREARAVGGVAHPNVVTLYDVEGLGDEAFIVMEHVEGGSLAARLAAGPLTPEAFRRVASGLLRGLEAVHAAGIVHRDVKPSNVLLTPAGDAKLADFGVAHLPGFETTLGPGAVVGTVRYMSPEQARGRPCTVRSDLFSAGVTLFEAFTGVRYLEAAQGESSVEVQMRAASAPPFRGWAALPPALEAWFARALDPVPSRRFASASGMESALMGALEGRPPALADAGPAAADDPFPG